MSEIIIQSIKQPFTMVPNFIINDATLLSESRMTWIYLFSKAGIKNCTARSYDVQKALGFGDHVWRKVSKQLRERGYLVLLDSADGSKLKFTWSWSQLIHDDTVDNAQ